MSTPSVNIRHFDTFSQVQDAAVGATAIKDVMSGPCRIKGISVANVGGSANAVWLKMYDDLNPTVGTTAPAYSFPIPINFSDSIPVPVEGLKFVNGLSYCVEDTSGGTAGTSAPADTVSVGMTLLEGIQ